MCRRVETTEWAECSETARFGVILDGRGRVSSGRNGRMLEMSRNDAFWSHSGRSGPCVHGSKRRYGRNVAKRRVLESSVLAGAVCLRVETAEC